MDTNRNTIQKRQEEGEKHEEHEEQHEEHEEHEEHEKDEEDEEHEEHEEHEKDKEDEEHEEHEEHKKHKKHKNEAPLCYKCKKIYAWSGICIECYMRRIYADTTIKLSAYDNIRKGYWMEQTYYAEELRKNKE